MKKYTLSAIMFLFFFTNTIFATNINVQSPETDDDSAIYSMSLKDLMQVNIILDSNDNFEPTYDVSISDLMQLKIVKELKVETDIDISYDIPIEELMKIELKVVKNATVYEPTYEMQLNGLMELNLVNKYSIIEKISLTYDISIDGLMKIKIVDTKSQ